MVSRVGGNGRGGPLFQEKGEKSGGEKKPEKE